MWWSKKPAEQQGQQISYDDIVAYWRAAGKKTPIDYTGNEKWSTVSLEDVDRIGITDQLKSLRYGQNGVDCGWMQTVWYSAFAGKEKAVGVCLGYVTGRYKDNHYFGWFVDHEKRLRFYDPVERWELPADIVKAIIRSRIN